MAYVLSTIAACVGETLILILLWRLFKERRWAPQGLWLLGIVAALFLVALPASQADSEMELWIAATVVIVPLPVAMIAKSVQVGKAQAVRRGRSGPDKTERT